MVFRSQFSYKNAVDALTGETIELNDIDLRTDDARWAQMEK